MYRAGFYDHHEPGMSIVATANASGVAQGFLGPVPQGYCWYVERMTSWSNTAATSGLLLEVFVQTVDDAAPTSATVGNRTGRQDVSYVVVNDISDNNSPIHVPEGYFLVAFWTGLTSGDKVELTTQIAVHLLSLDIEPRQLVQQQTEPTPDINPEDVQEQDGLIARLEHATADLFRTVEKAI